MKTTTLKSRNRGTVPSPRRTEPFTITQSGKGPLSPEELRKLDAWWRAANYLSVGQIYLFDNPLLRKPLKPELLASAWDRAGRAPVHADVHHGALSVPRADAGRPRVPVRGGAFAAGRGRRAAVTGGGGG